MSTSVLSALRASLERAELLGRDLLVGLSGGLDSTCLLRLLAELASREGGRLEVAHVDHGLRPDSGADARFCRGAAEELGLPFHLLELTPVDFGGGRGLQAEARRRRRAFFERTLAARALDAVALAHHADDQVETVLLRLLRGVGPRGVGGMAEWSPPYVRPLLDVRRSDLEALVHDRGWVFREDPSNRSGRYLRNRVRHELLPVLRELQPLAEAALVRFARLAAEDDGWLSREAAEALSRLGTREPEGFRLPVEGLAALPRPIRRRVWLAAWEAVGADPAALEARHLDLADDLLRDGRPQRRAPVPGPAALSRCWGDVWVLRPDATIAVEREVVLPTPGRVALGVFEVEAVCGPGRGDATAVPLLPGRPVGALVLRPRRPGDRLGHRKAKDVLMEARVPSWRRARTLVLEDRAGVLGLLGPGVALGLPEAAREPSNCAVWLEESGEKRWCP